VCPRYNDELAGKASFVSEMTGNEMTKNEMGDEREGFEIDS
jgi:hypothetical protein